MLYAGSIVVLTTFHTLGAKVVRADEALSVALANRKQVFGLTVYFFLIVGGHWRTALCLAVFGLVYNI